MADWICPRCRRRHVKRLTVGGVRARLPNGMVAREALHEDVVCECGEKVPGASIAAGLHDPPPLALSPLPKALLGSAAAGLMAAGVALVFASGSTALVVGGAVFAAYLVLHLALFAAGVK